MAKVNQKEAQKALEDNARLRARIRKIGQTAKNNQAELEELVVGGAAAAGAGYLRKFRENKAAKGESVLWDIVEEVPGEGIVGLVAFFGGAKLKGDLGRYVKEAGRGLVYGTLAMEVYDRTNPGME